MVIEMVVEADKEEELPIDANDADETVDAQDFIISNYGADFDVEGLVRRLDRGDIEIPDFQRAFVWNQKRASRFIESLLIGLPVPGIFLYRERDSQTLRVIDGQQRLISLKSYYNGQFPGSTRKFRLTGVNKRFEGKAYTELLPEDRRKLNNSIIHASIIQQDAPDDNGTSQFSLFERLNTTSTPLSSQEIRATVYRGTLNELLVELNSCEAWRTLIGKPNLRKHDQELILRFFALYYDLADYRRNLKEFLNEYMKGNQQLNRHSADDLRELFTTTVRTILEKLDRRAFRRDRAVNAALTDALMVGIARRLERGPIDANIRNEYERLMNDQEFVASISAGTSQLNNVRTRIDLATEAFAGVE
ncbi:MAG: DUF262 domain-containing protein [Chloroflexi bacterium]|nr:DUF262 domain-containing protein [Chloroflexota bacterium]